MALHSRLLLLLVSLVSLPSAMRAQDADRMAEYIQRRDDNRNGVLEPEEWQSSRMRYLYEQAARENGLDLNKPLPIDQVLRGMNTIRERNGGNLFGGSPMGGYGSSGWGQPYGAPSSLSSSSSSSSDSNKDKDKDKDKEKKSEKDKKSSVVPGVPGFGESQNLPPVPGFGTALESIVAQTDAGTESTSGLSDKDRSRDSRSDERKDTSREERDRREREERERREREDRERREREENRRYAKSMIELNDKNKDGVLAKKDDEWGGLRGDPSNADYNKDGIITADELTERLIERARESSGWSRGSSSGSSSRSTVGTNGKPLRFSTPIERLPEGMPSWFTRADLNGDGQVSMFEYATKWDEGKVLEYARYDLNNDGFITPTECLAADKQRSSSSSYSGSYSKSSSSSPQPSASSESSRQ